MRVLLIEDDSLIGDGIKTGLEKLGFAVDWFTDGNDGTKPCSKPNMMPLSSIWACPAETVSQF